MTFFQFSVIHFRIFSGVGGWTWPLFNSRRVSLLHMAYPYHPLMANPSNCAFRSYGLYLRPHHPRSHPHLP